MLTNPRVALLSLVLGVFACRSEDEPEGFGGAGGGAGGPTSSQSGGAATSGGATNTSGGSSAGGGVTGSGGTTMSGGAAGGVAGSNAGGSAAGGKASESSGGANDGGTMSGGGVSGSAGNAGRSFGGRRGSGGRAGTGGAGGMSSAGTSSAGMSNGSGGTSAGGSSSAGAGGCVENLACKLTAPPTTGDLHQDCVDRVNQFRTQCACLPALARWTEGEACADQMAQYDSEKDTAHAGFKDDICPGGSGQNECPGYSSNTQVISLCLQQMWDEGPPPMDPCDGTCFSTYGHFINMTNTRNTKVACGFYTTSAGKVWAVQNFSR